MNEIKCPKCGTVFTIDEKDYLSILKQIRDDEFNKQIQEREKLFEIDKGNAVKIKTVELEKIHQEEIAKKDEELIKLHGEIERLNSTREAEIKNAKNEVEKELKDEISKLNIKNVEKEKIHQEELLKLQNEIDTSNKNREVELKNIKVETEKDYQEKINQLTIQIKELENTIKVKDNEKETELLKISTEKDQELQKLEKQIELKQMEYELDRKSEKEKYEIELKQKDKTIEFYRDLKARQSTKMIGETLEQHCYAEFNKIRSVLSRNAYFEKDNATPNGSKGDFIFRETDDEGNEILSIMFEMKNEADETSTKHKNEDFFKELDKDRREKNCEYAVLVSLLEIDSELYNIGIVDVSHKYEKMYVIRPQFFVPIITLLRNTSMKSLDYKKQLEQIKNQNIDITHFEERLLSFRDGFSKNYNSAKKNFNSAIEEIDKAIKRLEAVKEYLTTSGNQLRLANDKAEGLTLKKLLKDNKTMSEMFGQVKKDKELIEYAKTIEKED